MSLYLLGLLLYSHEKSSLSLLEPESTILVCTLSDYPEEKPNSIMLSVRLHQKSGLAGPEKLKGSMIMYMGKKNINDPFTPGDRLVVRCIPSQVTNRGNPYEFNYKFYLENLGIKYSAFIEEDDILDHSRQSRRTIKHFALIIRRKIIDMYRNRGVSEEMLPLVSALTLGEKSQLDQETKENFVQAGIMHIMAVSGLHAVILSMFVLNILFFLKPRYDKLRIFIAILFLWSFAFITGLTPSVLRATLMFTFFQTGNMMHRKVNGINSVLASAFVLTLIRPSVIFDAGFLLSYSAVIFIIAFYRSFYQLLNPGNRVTNWIWQSIAVTIVAQLGTLPFTVTLFNRFPVWFILTNLVIVPLSSLAIILGCLVPLFYPVKIISGIIALLLDRLTFLTEILTGKAAQLPFAGITGIGMTTVGCILLFGALFAFMTYVSDRRKNGIRVSLFFLLMWVSVSAFTSIRIKTSNELIVYNTKGPAIIGVRTGNKLHIYCDTLILSPEINRHRSAAGLNVIYHKISYTPVILKAGEKKIIFCKPPLQSLSNVQDAEFLIMSGFGRTQSIGIRSIPGNIIVLSGFQAFTFGNHSPPPVHYIRKSGAYICEL